MDQYKSKKIKENLWKILVVVFALAFAAVVTYFRLDSIVSRFRFYKDGQTLIFVDKYVSAADNRHFRASWKSIAEKFLAESGLDKALSGKQADYRPEVVFLVQNYYSIIDLQDPYIEKKLRGKPSTDIQLLQKARTSSFFDSFISHSFTSQDGRYIFISEITNLEEDVVYAIMHGLAGKNMPDSAKTELRGDSNWNFDTFVTWMMIEEMTALTAQELQKAFTAGKTLDQGLDAILELPADYYTNQESNPVKKFTEYYFLNFQISNKIPELYQMSLDMAKHLIGKLGYNGYMSYIAKIAGGNYSTVNELVFENMTDYINPVLTYYDEISRIARKASRRVSAGSTPAGQ